MDTKTITLTEFLQARIVEDEAAARRAIDFPYSIRSTPWGGTFEIVADSLDSRADHWLCVDPARVLAECEAKRRIVAIHDWAPQVFYTCAHEKPAERMICGECGGLPDQPCDTLRALSVTYADHPDYREEWRP